MGQRYDDAWIAAMLSAERAALAPPEALLTGAGAGPGSTVVDVGCGPGFFTLPAAHLIGPTGRVYAVDTEARMLSYVADEATRRNLTTITPVLAQDTDVPLPDACADLVVCALLLHDLPIAERRRMTEELRRLCRPGGAVLVVEWLPRPAEARWNRLAPAQTMELLVKAGLPVWDQAYLGELSGADGEHDGMYRLMARRPLAAEDA